jgi:general secretion pathway protein G
MHKRQKGFTLIELLMVVAIIAILSAILVPSAATAIQKAKQKQTMKDIISIATASTDYVTDHGFAPDEGTQSGALSPGCDFADLVSPIYIKICPIYDQWGNPFNVYSGSAVSSAFGILESTTGPDDIVVASFGKDGVDEGWAYDAENPSAGLYKVAVPSDFMKDLVNINGTWIRGPSFSVEDTADET